MEIKDNININICLAFKTYLTAFMNVFEKVNKVTKSVRHVKMNNYVCVKNA